MVNNTLTARPSRCVFQTLQWHQPAGALLLLELRMYVQGRNGELCIECPVSKSELEYYRNFAEMVGEKETALAKR